MKRIKQRPQAGVLGKYLTRRSRGRCELCDSTDQTRVFELPPFPPDPDPDRALIACARCRTWLDRGKIDPIEAHFLSEAVWSEVPPVRLAAARLLLSHDGADDPWLREALEMADIDPATGEWR